MKNIHTVKNWFRKRSTRNKRDGNFFRKPSVAREITQLELGARTRVIDENMLRCFYGDALIQRVLDRYGWPKLIDAGDAGLGLFLQSLGAQALRTDILALSTTCIQTPIQENNQQVLNCLLPRTDQEQLISSLKQSPNGVDGHLAISQACPSLVVRLMKLFFQGLSPNGRLIDFGFSKEELRALRYHYDSTQIKKAELDRRLREIHTSAPLYQVFPRDTDPNYLQIEQQLRASGEFFGRVVAYKQLRPGMLIPCPIGAEQYALYQVIDGVDEHGFAVFTLQNIQPSKAGDIRLLSRGTNPRDVLSIRGCLGDSVGATPLEENSESIISSLGRICNRAGVPVRLTLHGHSQGGAISQLLCGKLTTALVTDNTNAGLKLTTEIHLSVWNSPGVSNRVTDRFALQAAQLADPASGAFCSFSIEYNQVRSDPVHKMGVQYVGTHAVSRNVRRAIYRYRTNSHRPLLGPHCTPIHGGDHNEPLEAFVDDPVRFVQVLRQYTKARSVLVFEEEISHETIHELVQAFASGKETASDEEPLATLKSAQAKLQAVLYQLLEVDARLKGSIFNNLLDSERKLANRLLDTSKRNLEEITDSRKHVQERVRPALKLTGQSAIATSLAGLGAAALALAPVWATIGALAFLGGSIASRTAYHWMRKARGPQDPLTTIAEAVRSRLKY